MTSFTASLRDIRICTPELPEAQAFRVYDAIEARERQLINPDRAAGELLLTDYAEGTAAYDDETLIIGEDNMTIVASADHATDPVRKATGRREGADHGTAGLVHFLAEAAVLTGIIPLGRQTGNANTSGPEYPVKQYIKSLLPGRVGFLSVHGMMPGKVINYDETEELHAIIGLGRAPGEANRNQAKSIVETIHNIGFRACIGNDAEYMTRDSQTGMVQLAADGSVRKSRLAALGPNTTTNWARTVSIEQGSEKPAMQIELTRALRLLPRDFENGWHVDKTARVMGVYAGYLIARSAAHMLMREVC